MSKRRCPTCLGPAGFRGAPCYECKFGERDRVLMKLNEAKYTGGEGSHDAFGDYRQKRTVSHAGAMGPRRAPDRVIDGRSG